jgi:hypothetical protein
MTVLLTLGKHPPNRILGSKEEIQYRQLESLCPTGIT